MTTRLSINVLRSARVRREAYVGPWLAIARIAAYQGIALLTNTFRDPELMTREARRLDRWIDSLAARDHPTRDI
ncbi:MAG: hypothetical protein ACRDPM_11385 [Solirubrobacteraceae bacterium]